MLISPLLQTENTALSWADFLSWIFVPVVLRSWSWLAIQRFKSNASLFQNCSALHFDIERNGELEQLHESGTDLYFVTSYNNAWFKSIQSSNVPYPTKLWSENPFGLNCQSGSKLMLSPRSSSFSIATPSSFLFLFSFFFSYSLSIVADVCAWVQFSNWVDCSIIAQKCSYWEWNGHMPHSDDAQSINSPSSWDQSATKYSLPDPPIVNSPFHVRSRHIESG
jgi:hypothetical protein